GPIYRASFNATLRKKAVKSPEARCSRNKGLLQRSREKAQSKLNGKLDDEKAREAFIQANLQQLAEIENAHGAFDVSIGNFQKVLRDEMGKTY
ncbi:MAG: hypothetical protein AAFX62_14140, partial [Pseudomonadota bacterium]